MSGGKCATDVDANAPAILAGKTGRVGEGECTSRATFATGSIPLPKPARLTSYPIYHRARLGNKLVNWHLRG